ncbi:MAG: HAD-IC family P-type ATPase, partial [Methylococcales bacterium]|nr:HAD-IC family P-type ATPase [Methylococcales bacterium]
NSAYHEGQSLIMVALENNVIGAIELHPTFREGAEEVVRRLQTEYGIKHLYVISGDNAQPTRKLAQALGIENYFSNVLPQEKAAIIEQLQKDGKTVCYIGDGINDAIALKKAHVSISLKGASSVATDTAQIILMSENLNQLLNLFEYSKKFETTMGQSLYCILGHSVVAAAGVFVFGFTIVDTLIIKQIGLTIALMNSAKPLIIDQDSISKIERTL